MQLIPFIAWRYVKSKKSTQAIQVISWVSIGAMAIGTAALIIVLSVFNGFEGFIKNLYADYYPSFKISPEKGKHFIPAADLLSRLQELPTVKGMSLSLEEKVMLRFDNQQVIIVLKGVDSAYTFLHDMDKHVQYGEMKLQETATISPIVLGLGISNRLGATEETHRPITCYAFTGKLNNILDISSSYHSTYFEVRGVYSLQEEIDNQIAFASLEKVREVIRKSDVISSIELDMNENVSTKNTLSSLKSICAPHHLKVESRYEQNRTLYFILSSERWIVYCILTFMLVIASFTIIGSMSMLVLEKSKDIRILNAMGANNLLIVKFFLATGVLLAFLGALIGSGIAYTICLLQLKFGIVTLGSGDAFLLEAYPVAMHLTDFVLVMGTVIIIAFFASLYPAIQAGRQK
jgi:lipoprotein-releasing system permease protein